MATAIRATGAGGNDIAVGALVLFLTNLAAIIVVAGMVMSFQGYRRWKRGLIGLEVVTAASIFLMQSLSQEMHKLNVARSLVGYLACH